MQKVLVTGATGFVGIKVSRQLAERGMHPRLMVRRPVRGLMLRNLDAEIMQADIRSSESLRRILTGIDTVSKLNRQAGAFICNLCWSIWLFNDRSFCH